jgi:hypothetical protein
LEPTAKEATIQESLLSKGYTNKDISTATGEKTITRSGVFYAIRELLQFSCRELLLLEASY